MWIQKLVSTGLLNSSALWVKSWDCVWAWLGKVRGWSQNSFSLSTATCECSGFIHVTNEGKWSVSAHRNDNMTVDTAKRSFGISLVRDPGSDSGVGPGGDWSCVHWLFELLSKFGWKAEVKNKKFTRNFVVCHCPTLSLCCRVYGATVARCLTDWRTGAQLGFDSPQPPRSASLQHPPREYTKHTRNWSPKLRLAPPHGETQFLREKRNSLKTGTRSSARCNFGCDAPRAAGRGVASCVHNLSGRGYTRGLGMGGEVEGRGLGGDGAFDWPSPYRTSTGCSARKWHPTTTGACSSNLEDENTPGANPQDSGFRWGSCVPDLEDTRGGPAGSSGQ